MSIALFGGHAAPHLGRAKTHVQIGGAIQGAQKLLLVLVRLRITVRGPQDVVVVSAEKLSPFAQLIGEGRDAQIEALAALFQAVIEIAAVYEYRYSVARVFDLGLFCQTP